MLANRNKEPLLKPKKKAKKRKNPIPTEVYDEVIAGLKIISQSYDHRACFRGVWRV